MSVQINIAGQIISFPVSGDSPDWGQAVTKFAQAVESALSAVVGNFDVPPQSFNLSADVNTNVIIPNLTFPTSNVSGAIVTIGISRINSGGNTQHEVTTIDASFDGSVWVFTRESAGRVTNSSNNTLITFDITPQGQFRFSTIALGGTFQSGLINYTAKAILNS